jgi:beta-RFAP synthase
MTAFRIATPSRLHFGLLALGPAAPRRFGGVGLMIDRPGLLLAARPADRWEADGPLADRTLRFARAVADRLAAEGHLPRPSRFTIQHAPAEHVGLGTGTQLGLAVARVVAEHAGLGDLPVARLAALAGRGLRSGIGLHGFALGGLVVDGGRRRDDEQGIPPLLCRHELPDDWHVLVVLPGPLPGLHGHDEVRAFASLPPIADAETDRLCRLVLLGLLPAVVERDLDAFGRALTELQHEVGRLFSPAQHGLYAHPDSAAIVRFLRAEGLHGVGQSSWGPALYALGDGDAWARAATLQRLRDRFPLPPDSAFWAAASRSGAVVSRLDDD